jgi:hypothetical protein
MYLSSQTVPSQYPSESQTLQSIPPGSQMLCGVGVGSRRNLGGNLSLDSEALHDSQLQPTLPPVSNIETMVIPLYIAITSLRKASLDDATIVKDCKTASRALLALIRKRANQFAMEDKQLVPNLGQNLIHKIK